MTFEKTDKNLTNIKWNKEYCKFCNICIEMCPKKCLSFKDNILVQGEGCIKCKICEKYCPDIAIEIIKND